MLTDDRCIDCREPLRGRVVLCQSCAEAADLAADPTRMPIAVLVARLREYGGNAD